MKSILALLLFSLFFTFGHTQTQGVSHHTKNVYMEKGDYYFDKKDYKKSIVYYNMSFNKDNNFFSLLKKAEAYMAIGLNEQAIESYRIFFKTDKPAANNHLMNYALLLLHNKNITGFEQWIKSYNANMETEIKKMGAELYKDSVIIIVENEGVLNSAESEISPVVFGDGILFSSTRSNITASKVNNNYNVFSAAYIGTGQLGRLNTFNKNLDSEMDETALFFSEAKESMFFSKNSLSNLKTYFTRIPSKKDEMLNFTELKLEGFENIGHVTLNDAGTKMYFVSDAPGGKGGLDIYSADFVNGKWTNPQNLGDKINTAKDDMYPFLLKNTLYFTSGGHNSLGGLDLFSVNLAAETLIVKNLGSKINTKFDESALSFSKSGLTGYFSSNRPGGFGKDDIYRLQNITFKVEKPAFRFKTSSSIQDGKINLYMNDGSEYNIASKDKTGFHFSFEPQEGYNMVIQQENPEASDVINNTSLTPEKRIKGFLDPKPIERTVIELEKGMVFHFHVGMDPISKDYKDALNEMAGDYQNNNSNAIDLTILAKELLLRKGEIYTIHFEKRGKEPLNEKEKTSLKVNTESIDVNGRSFFIMLPLDIESNFNIKTDIEHFKETHNPKKVGKLTVDTEPIIKAISTEEAGGFPILVNTEEFEKESDVIRASELTIIPGSQYMLSLRKSFYGTDAKVDIFVPMTKGVKYNLGSEAVSVIEYDERLAKLKAKRRGESISDENKIGVSVLSKELKISPDDTLVFTLLPQEPDNVFENVYTMLHVDGRVYQVNTTEKWQVLLMFDDKSTLNLQTDLEYLEENFESSNIELDIDKESFNKEIEVETKKINTDPVFGVIVANFDLGKFNIRDDAKSIIESKVIKELLANDKLYVTIKGYTDPLGNAEFNEKLSKDRAQSVKDYLTERGIGEKRIRTFSYGETESLKKGVNWEDLSEAELQKHRKVEIKMYLPKK